MSTPDWARVVRADNPGPMTLEGTNTWILDGVDGVVVVDPGPLDETHLRRVAAHRPVRLILLTHGHADHAAGADRFVALTGAPLAAQDPALCRGAAPLAAGPLRVDAAGLDVEVLPAPGHTADSVCLLVRRGGRAAVLTGDTILGRGTTVVAHPDGRLGDYLDTLRRLAGLGPVPVLPGHGPVRPDVAAAAAAYLQHREDRLAQVRAAVAAGRSDPAAVVAAVYADVDRAVWPAAEQSVRATLDYLRERGELSGPVG